MEHHSKKRLRLYFTDRDRGEGLILSGHRATSGAGKREHIKPDRVNPAGIRRMKRQLFCMCQNVRHVYKQVVNWEQMYNNYRCIFANFLLYLDEPQ